MRGKLISYDAGRGEYGITPAGAGKTRCCDCQRIEAWDHPRRCGENALILSATTGESGSPPQVRGKHNVYRLRDRTNGITPAGAGKTLAGVKFEAVHKDHPRRCGENMHLRRAVDCDTGSPPQVRGKLRVTSDFRNVVGITPAGAGKTKSTATCDCIREDHPRRCGENRHGDTARHGNVGSPPQVRGKQRRHNKCRTEKGITPAGAGKTAYMSAPLIFSGDHPRRCGENGTFWSTAQDETGSPPQVRGKLLQALFLACATRITPAGAGKTSQTWERSAA